MRMRRKPWAHAFLQAQPQVTFDASQLKHEWTKLAQHRPLCVEFGSGKGDYVSTMAKLYPEYFWIAVEKDENVAATALKKAERLAENVYWIVGDAKAMLEWFNQGSVTHVYLNFSDPWPKKHHAKRRLSSESFIQQMLTITTADAQFFMKTDNRKLFEYTVLQWQHQALSLCEFSVDYRSEEHPEDATTEYERRFMELNQPIYRGVWRKTDVK